MDWQDVPAHSHFYIKSLLYFFNWNILMCFASLILCINSVLRDLKPCTVRARSNVLDSLLDLWRGREKNASRVLGVVTRKRKKKKRLTINVPKTSPCFACPLGKTPSGQCCFSGWVLGRCFRFWLTAVKVDQICMLISPCSSECIFNMYIYVQGPSVLKVMEGCSHGLCLQRMESVEC